MGAICLVQFWTLANELFNAQEAKRLYAIQLFMPIIAAVEGRSNPSAARRLIRHILRFTAIAAVLVGANIVFYGRWAYPNQTLPPALTENDDRTSAPGLANALSDKLLACLRAGREHGGLPSMPAAIAIDGQVQWAGATGYAGIENRSPPTVGSRYRTGSVAKPITAVALMRLAEAGKVALDAPTSQYVPGLPLPLQPLTAMMLGSHRAGIRHYSLGPQWWMGWHETYSTHHYETVEAGLTLFVNDSLRSEPGTEFKYSTFGYSLLARLLEGATGTPFAQVLDENVLQAAGMTSTSVDTPDFMPNRVAFYEAQAGRFTPSHPIDSSYKIAGGGLVSTPTDLARLGTALLSDGFVSAAAKKRLWTPSVNPEK